MNLPEYRRELEAAQREFAEQVGNAADVLAKRLESAGRAFLDEQDKPAVAVPPGWQGWSAGG